MIFALAVSLKACAFTLSTTVTSPLPSIFTCPRLFRTSPAVRRLSGVTVAPDPKEFSDGDMIIVGDPEQCIEKMIRYAELGVDQLICYVQFGSLSHESVMTTIELLGKELIPELAKREITVETKVSGPASADTLAQGIID